MTATYEQKDFSAVEMALAVLMDRINSLSKEDRDDLFELSKAFFSAHTKEELDAARMGMQEILEQSDGRMMKVSPVTEPGDELKKWVDWVSNQIKRLRKQAGLTQVQLAEKSGIPQSHISRLENGEHSPSFITLEKIASALNVPVSRLDPSA